MNRWIVLLALGLVSLNAKASLIQVSSPEDLGAGEFTLETFERRMRHWDPGVSYNAPSGVRRRGAGRMVGGVTPSGRRGLSTRGRSESITFTFADPTSALGMYFGNDGGCCRYTAFLDIFDGAELVRTLTVEANLNDFADQFIGFVSRQPITSVVLRYQREDRSRHRIYVDDLYFNRAADALDIVTVPGTLSLILLGVTVLRSQQV